MPLTNGSHVWFPRRGHKRHGCFRLALDAQLSACGHAFPSPRSGVLSTQQSTMEMLHILCCVPCPAHLRSTLLVALIPWTSLPLTLLCVDIMDEICSTLPSTKLTFCWSWPLISEWCLTTQASYPSDTYHFTPRDFFFYILTHQCHQVRDSFQLHPGLPDTSWSWPCSGGKS